MSRLEALEVQQYEPRGHISLGEFMPIIRVVLEKVAKTLTRPIVVHRPVPAAGSSYLSVGLPRSGRA